MNNLPSFFTVVTDTDRFHQAATITKTITGQIVHMKRIQAKRTMIAVTSITEGKVLKLIDDIRADLLLPNKESISQIKAEAEMERDKEWQLQDSGLSKES